MAMLCREGAQAGACSHEGEDPRENCTSEGPAILDSDSGWGHVTREGEAQIFCQGPMPFCAGWCHGAGGWAPAGQSALSPRPLQLCALEL